MKVHFRFTLSLILFSAIGYSQEISFQSLNSISGTFQSEATSLNFNVGELAVGQFKFGEIILSSGTYPIISLITGLVEIESRSEEISIYPNPTADLINVLVGDNQNTMLRMRLYRSDGKQIISKSFVKATTIHLDEYPVGIYCLIIENLSNNKTTSHKIIKY